MAFFRTTMNDPNANNDSCVDLWAVVEGTAPPKSKHNDEQQQSNTETSQRPGRVEDRKSRISRSLSPKPCATRVKNDQNVGEKRQERIEGRKFKQSRSNSPQEDSTGTKNYHNEMGTGEKRPEQIQGPNSRASRSQSPPPTLTRENRNAQQARLQREW
eukprot:CAMPEP_0194221230 /NCGR_PEP_ID=MMETSP0156-20130528/30193_1 /TAXON_ID=33649 /ORGANISM="Thalassionema nitzschioides, Strain L26-B" /LENGTH=157 /DNA_ID=CAMNT_0038951567 /DNA_START=34 /DNA_END=504 /DNA_ORIENTATION=+